MDQNNTNNQSPENISNSDDLKKLLELSLQKNEEILKISKDIKQYIKWQQIWSTLRLLLVIVPIVLGFIYLPPILKDLFESYRGLLGK